MYQRPQLIARDSGFWAVTREQVETLAERGLVRPGAPQSEGDDWWEIVPDPADPGAAQRRVDALVRTFRRRNEEG